MSRRFSLIRPRVLRWLVCVGVVPMLWACGTRRLAAPNGGPLAAAEQIVPAMPSRDIDILFVVDDSLSMRPLQQKLTQRLPDFMNVLKELPGGLPNLHAAVISSSLGAGIYGNVPGCAPGTAGNTDGKFQHATQCPLHQGATFIKSIAGVNNFDGSIEAVFSCIALLGDGGCGFEHQFESTMLALQKAGNPSDPDNAGFLRPNALLAVIMLTNEDDCSVPADSTLFDPGQISLVNPLGGLQSYRCNEFGHLCDGVPPPHDVTGPTPLNNCQPAEGRGRLTATSDFVAFIKSLKSDPAKIFVAALAGPTAPYVVFPQQILTAGGVTETQPAVQHSCTATNGDYADPAVRVRTWLDAFGNNAVFESICADDFRPAMIRIAEALSRTIRPQCINGAIAAKADGTPDCRAAIRSAAPARGATDVAIPLCDGTPGVLPCFGLVADPMNCPVGRKVQICWDGACDPARAPTEIGNVSIICGLLTEP